MTRPPLDDQLDLSPHPEGGWYRQTWASPVAVTLPDGRVRPTATLIHFWLPAGDSSAWHQVRSDELWLAHTGTVTLEIASDPDAVATTHVVGTSLAVGEESQVLVAADLWQRTVPTEADALVSCLVSPGFHFDDFELAP